MISRKNLENSRLNDSEDLCALVEKLGYGKGRFQQLACKNGAYVSSLLEFFDDNPGAMEALVEWIGENHPEVTDSEECNCCGEECDADGDCATEDCDNFGKPWDNEGDTEEDDENDPEACPGCGCKPGDGITESCFHPHGCGDAKLRRAEGRKDE